MRHCAGHYNDEKVSNQVYLVGHVYRRGRLKCSSPIYWAKPDKSGNYNHLREKQMKREGFYTRLCG